MFSLGMVILEGLFGTTTGVYRANYRMDRKRLVEYVSMVEKLECQGKTQDTIVRKTNLERETYGKLC